jgi:uncharacterized phage protein (TIGR01671 family)
MEREIKFRAFDDGRMIYPTHALSDIRRFFRVIRSDAILMQFIGLKDKNGKDIYEKDFVKDSSGNVMLVGWNKMFASFCLDKKGWAFSHYFGEAVNPEDIEIIGNIYENASLLK